MENFKVRIEKKEKNIHPFSRKFSKFLWIKKRKREREGGEKKKGNKAPKFFYQTPARSID